MRKCEFYDAIPRSRVSALLADARLPGFFYFTEIVDMKIDALTACLPQGFRVHYAFKANPNGALLRHLRSRGLGADVASIGELRRALEAGFAPEAVEFTGPGKNREELAAAVESGVGAVNAESLREIEVLAEIARGKGRAVNIGVRINPRTAVSASGMRMGGDTQFGIIEDDLAEAFELIRRAGDALRFVGYHFHLGSQFMRAEDVLCNFEGVLEAASRLSARHGMHPEKINLGGGWGVDMFGRRDGLDMEAVRNGLVRLIGRQKPLAGAGPIRYVVEPGRFLVAECGLYAVPVLYRKRGYKRTFLVVDGGLHQHFAAAGGIGQGIRRNYEVDCVSATPESQALEKFTVAGCLCLPSDILAADVELPASTSPGDVLVFFNSGAYAYAASPTRFLSHPEPVETVL